MNIEKTLLIAEQLGLNHPIDPKTKAPICMTSDFCITVRFNGSSKDIIRTIKPAVDLMHRRTLEKFEIERTYWEQEGLDWGIVTDYEIHKIAAKNISTIRVAYNLTNVPDLQGLEEGTLNGYKQELVRRLVCEENTTRKVIHSFAKDFHLPEGACIALFRHLLATKVLFFNLREELNLNVFNRFKINHEIMEELLIAEYQEA